MDYKIISKLTCEIKKDSEKHFKIFFDKTHAMVFGICLRMGLSKENAEEVVQDTFVQFWKQRKSIDENSGILGLLRIIAKRLVIKKINGEVQVVEFNPDKLNLQPDTSNLDLIFNSDLLNRKLQKLPDAQRQIINLFYTQGLSTIEISEHLGVSVRTVENNLYRAKKRLKEILDKNDLNLSSFYDS